MVFMKDPEFGIVGGKLKLAGCVLELRICLLLVPELSKQDRYYETFRACYCRGRKAHHEACSRFAGQDLGES